VYDYGSNSAFVMEVVKDLCEKQRIQDEQDAKKEESKRTALKRAGSTVEKRRVAKIELEEIERPFASEEQEHQTIARGKGRVNHQQAKALVMSVLRQALSPPHTTTKSRLFFSLATSDQHPLPQQLPQLQLPPKLCNQLPQELLD
jgi:hypothetical protein